MKKIKDKKNVKYDLLDEVEHSREESEKNLNTKLLFGVFLVLFSVFFVILPKIYLKNEIYYNSRDISKLYNEYNILKEENIMLKRKLEYLKFKNQVLDTIF